QLAKAIVMAYSPPCITARRGGGAHQKLSRSHRRRRGGCPPAGRKTTPSSLSKDAAQHLLIARPPLLAVMQGGEYATTIAMAIAIAPLAPRCPAHCGTRSGSEAGASKMLPLRDLPIHSKENQARYFRTIRSKASSSYDSFAKDWSNRQG